MIVPLIIAFLAFLIIGKGVEDIREDRARDRRAKLRKEWEKKLEESR